MKRLVLAAVIIAVLAVAGCGNSLPSGAVAKVGDGVVTQAQFDQYMNQAKDQVGPSSSPFPAKGTPQYNQYAASLMDYLVQQELIAQQAAKLKITVTDQELQQRLTQLYSAYGGEKKVMGILAKQKMTLDQLKALLKTQLLGSKVYQQVIASAKPTEAQMVAYYNANKAQFDTPETRTVRHILVKTKAEALKVRALLAAKNTDAEWKIVAKQYTIDKNGKASGGALGVIRQGTMVPPFDKAAFSLPVNVLSQPVHSQYGWHIIEVQKIVPAQTSTYQTAKKQIEQTLASQNQQKAWTDWLAKAKADAHIIYAPGYDPAKLTPSPAPAQSGAVSPAASPTPTSTK